MSTIPTYIIMFGAGASYGSGSVIPRPPPMTAELLGALERLFPTNWGALPSEQRSLLHEDFEAGMRAISQRYPHALPPLQRSMASFFFNFIPGEGNLYHRLAGLIRNSAWQGALISLNYERLLELSLLAEGITPSIGSPPNGGRAVELCLPHGCCHIFCESVRGSARHISFAGDAVTTSGTVKVVPNPTEYANRIQHDAFPPVMSYFDPTKHTTSGVNLINSQRARYNEIVKSATVIAIIGVRVRPNDIHLWDSLAATEAEVIYCSGKSAGYEFEEWASEKRADKSNNILYCYFHEAFDELCKRTGLV